MIKIAHGIVTGDTFLFLTWLSFLLMVPVEIQSIIQYLAVFNKSLLNYTNSGLSIKGMSFAFLILISFLVLNALIYKLIIRLNNVISILKIIIPIFVSIFLLVLFFMKYTITISDMKSIPIFPRGVSGVFSAISIGGIAFAFVGFKSIIELSANCKNPKKAVPLSTLGSIILCFLVFFTLQMVYLVYKIHYASNHNWLHTTIAGASLSKTGPFGAIAESTKNEWLTYLIYSSAIIFPLMSGIIYFGVSCKILESKKIRICYLPTSLSTTLICFFFLLLFPFSYLVDGIIWLAFNLQ